ncbi:WYL domain-containing protein [bacterium]|nr:WYL domain-containing protein [candidate division CSSED10-310 bacterium]
MEDIQIIEKAIRDGKYIEFMYHDSRRVVAPYRLEQINNGRLVLRGLQEGRQTMRTFKLDEITGPDILERVVPAYLFETNAPEQRENSSPFSKLFSRFLGSDKA